VFEKFYSSRPILAGWFHYISYSGFQMSTHSFENKKSVPLRVLSFHFAVGKMKTAIVIVTNLSHFLLGRSQ